MLGCVAAVIEIVSPSQPRPAVIQSTSMTSGLTVGFHRQQIRGKGSPTSMSTTRVVP